MEYGCGRIKWEGSKGFSILEPASARKACLRNQLDQANERIAELEHALDNETEDEKRSVERIVVLSRENEQLREQNGRLRRLVARSLHVGFLPDPEPIGGWEAWEAEAESLGITFEEAEAGD